MKYHILPALLLAEVQRLERERATLAEELAALQGHRGGTAGSDSGAAHAEVSERIAMALRSGRGTGYDHACP